METAKVRERKPCGRDGPGRWNPCRSNTARQDFETARPPLEGCRSIRFQVLEDASSLSSCCCFPMQVQPALLLTRFPPPPACAAVFARLHRTRAGRAADAWIATVVKRVVGYAVGFDV